MDEKNNMFIMGKCIWNFYRDLCRNNTITINPEDNPSLQIGTGKRIVNQVYLHAVRLTKNCRKILITGSAKRIGAVIARYFAEKGHTIFVHCNTSVKEAEALVASFPNPSIHKILQADLTLPDAPAKLFKKLKKSPPDVLINNASVYSRIPLADATPSAVQDAMAINFMIPFELMRCFRNDCKKGNIINILDHRIDHPDPKSGPYAFAKKALRDATLAAAIDWAPDIRVNAVAPAFVLPPDGVPLEKMDRLIQASPAKVRPTPLDIARAIDYILQTPCLTGEIIHLASGLHLLSPEAAAQEKLKA